MSDLGFLNVAAATVGQTFTFNLGTPFTNQATITQMVNGQSDTVIINNLSGITFRVAFQPSGRSFTLPPGVPTNPLPLSFKGTNDSLCSLMVDSIIIGNYPNQVHFDWFSAAEPVLYVGASASTSAGSISLSSITATSIAFPTPDNWTISEDGSANLNFTNTTTGMTARFDANANFILPNSTILNVDGQVTAGNYGVPLIVAVPVVLRTHVTTTGTVGVAGFASVPSSAIYRISGFLTLDRASGAGTCTMVIAWTDTVLGTTQNVSMSAQNVSGTGAGSPVYLNATSLANGFCYALNSLTIDIAGGTAFGVDYTDSAAGPNDYTTIIVERLG